MINLLRVSLGGTFLILLLGIVRHFKFLSRKQVAFLWTLVMIRLLIVFSIPSVLWISIAPTSPLNSLGIVEEKNSFSQSNNSMVNANTAPIKSLMEDYQLLSEERLNKAETKAMSTSILTKPVVITVWLTGSGVSVILLLFLYISHGLRIRKSIQKNNDLFRKEWEQLFSSCHMPRIAVIAGKGPFVYSVLWPTLVLPCGYFRLDPEKRKLILLHEGFHILRKDNLRKLAFLLALCLNWYNPFVYIAFHWFQEDIEMACDEAVLGSDQSVEASKYARMLLSMAARKSRPIVTTLSTPPLKKRLKQTMEYRPQTRKQNTKATLVTILAVLLSFGMVITGCRSKDKGEFKVFQVVYDTFEQAVPLFEKPLSEVADIVMSNGNATYNEELHVYDSDEVFPIAGADFRMRIGNILQEGETFDYLSFYAPFEGDDGLDVTMQIMETLEEELFDQYGEPDTPRGMSYYKRFSDDFFPSANHMDFWDISKQGDSYRIWIFCVSDNAFGGEEGKYWIKIQIIENGSYLSENGGFMGY